MNKIILSFLLIVLTLVLLNKYWNKQAELKKSNKPKPVSISKRSQCSYQQPQIDKFITTTYKDYTFIYPCSAEPNLANGHYHKNLKKFEIKLLLAITNEKNNDTIWPQTPKDKDSVIHNARLRIFAGGKGIETPQVNAKKDNLEFIKSINNSQLDIYHNYRRVTGFLTQQKDAIGNNPVIKCTLDKPENLGTIFTEGYKNLNYDANCRAYWMLSEDITIKLYDFDASFAYDFATIYAKLNQDLKKIIHQQAKGKI